MRKTATAGETKSIKATKKPKPEQPKVRAKAHGTCNTDAVAPQTTETTTAIGSPAQTQPTVTSQMVLHDPAFDLDGVSLMELAKPADNQLLRRISALGRLYRRKPEYIVELAMTQWMESTGDLLIDRAVNRLNLPSKVKRSVSDDDETVLRFPSAPIERRISNVQRTHRHQAS